MSGTCSLLSPPGDPWPSCLLPSQLTCREWGAWHWKSSYHFHCDQTCLFLCGLFIFCSDLLESPFRKIGLLHRFSFPWVSVQPVLSRVVSDCSKRSWSSFTGSADSVPTWSSVCLLPNAREERPLPRSLTDGSGSHSSHSAALVLGQISNLLLKMGK